ncbi:hypothetical protein BLNAU_4595 [Blattamonas nauphoetae]|uniref:Uncharacterized protein n=1 Tax=Blattamonas nauphoetae TaxID=2049346 RepID=A0ABQ9Y9E4_9EUKA|nr:hypothetical protein BLNAU_4595 [Blattamonas nauphoetae]
MEVDTYVAEPSYESNYHQILLERNQFLERYKIASAEAGKLRQLLNRFKEIASQQASIQGLQQSSISLMKEGVSTVHFRNDFLAKEKEKTAQQIADAEERVLQAQIQQQHSLAQVQQIQNEIMIIKQEKEDIIQETQKEIQRMKDQTEREIENTSAAWNMEKNKMNLIHTRLERENTTQKQQIDQLSQKIASLESALTTKTMELTTLQMESSHSIEQLQSQVASVTQERDDVLTSLEQITAENRKDEAALKSKINEQNSMILTLQDDIRRTNEQLTQLSNTSSLQIEALTKERDDLAVKSSTQIESLKAENDALIETSTKLQTSLEEVQGVHERGRAEWKEEKTVLLTNNATLRLQLDELEKQKNEVETSLTAQLTTLTAQLEETTNTFTKQLEETTDTFTKQLAETQEILATTRQTTSEEIMSLRNDLSAAHKSIEVTKFEKEEMECTLTQTIEDQKKEMEEMKCALTQTVEDQKKETEEMRATMEMEIARLKRREEDLTGACEEIQRTAAETKAEADRAQAELLDSTNSAMIDKENECSQRIQEIEQRFSTLLSAKEAEVGAAKNALNSLRQEHDSAISQIATMTEEASMKDEMLNEMIASQERLQAQLSALKQQTENLERSRQQQMEQSTKKDELLNELKGAQQQSFAQIAALKAQMEEQAREANERAAVAAAKIQASITESQNREAQFEENLRKMQLNEEKAIAALGEMKTVAVTEMEQQAAIHEKEKASLQRTNERVTTTLKRIAEMLEKHETAGHFDSWADLKKLSRGISNARQSGGAK